MFTDNNGRTLKVDFISDEKFNSLAKSSKRLENEELDAVLIAATERTKLRDIEKQKAGFDYTKVGKRIEKSFELRTVDIKDLQLVRFPLQLKLQTPFFNPWQNINLKAGVEYGKINKHTYLNWADGTSLDLEGIDLEETMLIHKGFSLCIDDWTKDTTEYSDFWDSL